MSRRTSASKIFIQEANRWGWMSSAWPCPHIDRPWTTIPRAKEKPVVWTQTVEKTLRGVQTETTSPGFSVHPGRKRFSHRKRNPRWKHSLPGRTENPAGLVPWGLWTHLKNKRPQHTKDSWIICNVHLPEAFSVIHIWFFQIQIVTFTKVCCSFSCLNPVHV